MQKEKERVLIYGMTDNPGGIESYLLALTEHSPEGRFDFVCDFPSIAYRERLEARGCRIHFIPAKGKDLKGHLLALQKLLRTHPEYRTVYFNILDAGAAITAAVPRLLGRRVVVHSHNGGTDKDRLQKLCKPLLNLLASACVTCSDAAAAYMFTKRNARRALFIPNMIDVRAYRPDAAARERLRAALEIAPEETVVLHVGRISRQKNPLLLPEIAAALKKRSGAYRLLSVGDGEDRAAFEAKIREQGVEDTVLPLGVRGDLPAIYSAADVFILPSLYEGLPIVGVEAQAAGLPCLLSDRISPQIRLTDRVFFLSPFAGANAWADAIESHKADGRTDTSETLTAAGFDVSSADQAFSSLFQLF